MRRGAWMRWTGCASVVTLLAVSSAFAADPDRTIGLAYYVADDGTGILTANLSPDRWTDPSWERCLPDGSPCEPVASEFSGAILRTGDAPAGTIYRASASADGTTIVATSDRYGGRLTSSRIPTAQGSLRVGSLVTPIAGGWSGAWGGEQPFLQLQVCRHATGGHCEVISSTEYWDRCPGVGAVLRPEHQGLYLRVADQRYARIPIYGQRAFAAPSHLTPLTQAGNVAVATIGRIRAAAGPAESTCGGAPRYAWPPRRSARIERRLARIGSRVLATVRCTLVCNVRATIRQGGRVDHVAQQVRPTHSAPFVLPARDARRLAAGRARVTIRIDGRVRAARAIDVL